MNKYFPTFIKRGFRGGLINEFPSPEIRRGIKGEVVCGDRFILVTYFTIFMSIQREICTNSLSEIGK
jgi:hypothetical protein